jgi:hypothetical protein
MWHREFHWSVFCRMHHCDTPCSLELGCTMRAWQTATASASKRCLWPARSRCTPQRGTARVAGLQRKITPSWACILFASSTTDLDKVVQKRTS